MKVSSRLVVKDNWRTLIKLQRNVPKKTGKALDETAEAIVNYIRSNWSSPAPSSWGSPPAVRTGNLDESIVVESQGRDVLGRFTREDIVRYIVIDTDNDGRGQYSLALEDPYYLNRRFIEPAMEQGTKLIPHTFKKADIFDV